MSSQKPQKPDIYCKICDKHRAWEKCAICGRLICRPCQRIVKNNIEGLFIISCEECKKIVLFPKLFI